MGAIVNPARADLLRKLYSVSRWDEADSLIGDVEDTGAVNPGMTSSSLADLLFTVDREIREAARSKLFDECETLQEHLRSTLHNYCLERQE